MKIKICGLSNDCYIDYVNEAMPDFIGFVFAKSRRQVSFHKAEALQKRLRAGITPVGVFVNEPLMNVVKLLETGVIEVAQLHGGENETYIQELKARTQKPIIKAVRVSTHTDITTAEHSVADYLLLDNGSGGTGMSFDWKEVGSVAKPFFLAGGINVHNLEQAIAATQPYAVDLSSGVETDGVKDSAKISAVVSKVRALSLKR